MAEPISLIKGFVADTTMPVPKSKPFSDREKVIATILGEARSEKDEKGSSYEAMQAVANVIYNRKKRNRKKYKTFSDVVKQKAQFDFWGNTSDFGKANRKSVFSMDKNSKEYKDAVKITDLMFAGKLEDVIKGADHFFKHEEGVDPPSWAYKMSEVRKLLKHRFFDSRSASWTVPEETPFITPKKIPPTPVVEQTSNLEEDKTEQLYDRPYDKIFPELTNKAFLSKYKNRIDQQTLVNKATEAFIKYPEDFRLARKYFVENFLINSEKYIDKSMTGESIDYSRRKVEKKKKGGFVSA